MLITSGLHGKRGRLYSTEFYDLTFPVDLIPLIRQKKTTIQANMRHNTRYQWGWPNSSIPGLNCKATLLKETR